MSSTNLAHTLQFLEVLLLLTCMLALVEGEIDESAEEGDICSRHLLSSEDDARVYLGLHELLILVHVHLGSTDTIP